MSDRCQWFVGGGSELVQCGKEAPHQVPNGPLCDEHAQVRVGMLARIDDTLDGKLGVTDHEPPPFLHGSIADLTARANAAGFPTVSAWVDAMERVLESTVREVVAVTVDRVLDHLERNQATTKDEWRNPACVEAWPECETFGYDPRCCRFPKSCSAGIRRGPVS